MSPQNIADLPPDLLQPSDIVFYDTPSATLTELLVIRDRVDAVGARSTDRQIAYQCVGGRLWRIEYVDPLVVAEILEKIRGNLKRIPGGALSGAVDALLFWLREVGSVFGFVRYPRMRHLRSSRIEKVAIVLIGLLDRVKHRFGIKPPNLFIDYPSLEESTLLERLMSWNVLQRTHAALRWKRRVQAVNYSLHTALINLVLLQRHAEDIYGLSATHSEETVARMLREAFMNLAELQLAAHGLPSASVLTIFDRAKRLADGKFYADLKTGVFVSAGKVGDQILQFESQLNNLQFALRAHGVVAYAAKQISTYIDSDLTRTGKNQFHGSSHPRNGERPSLTETLARYGTSEAELLSLIPVLKSEDTVLLVGSLAKGMGHARSDIDIAVFTDLVPQLAITTVSEMVGHCDITFKTMSGFVVNIEYLGDAALQEFAPKFDEQLSEFTTSSAPEERYRYRDKLALLTQSSLGHIADRLHTGIELRRGERVNRWRKLLPFKEFSALAAGSFCAQYHMLLGEVGHTRCKEPEGVLLKLIEALSCAIKAVLAGEGEFVWKDRWLLEHIAKRGDKELYRIACHGLFPQDVDLESYWAWFNDVIRRLERRLVAHSPSAMPLGFLLVTPSGEETAVGLPRSQPTRLSTGGI